MEPLVASCQENINKKRKLENIFDISETKYVTNEDILAFYIKFRSIVCSHLKRKGDKLFSSSQEILSEDEILSPTFEEVIILWCLEKINPSLPSIVKETFSNQLKGNTSLKEIHEEIFQVIPDFIDCSIKNAIREQVEQIASARPNDFSVTKSFKMEDKSLQDSRHGEISTVNIFLCFIFVYF